MLLLYATFSPVYRFSNLHFSKYRFSTTNRRFFLSFVQETAPVFFRPRRSGKGSLVKELAALQRRLRIDLGSMTTTAAILKL
jgi:hypothetical protein